MNTLLRVATVRFHLKIRTRIIRINKRNSGECVDIMEEKSMPRWNVKVQKFPSPNGMIYHGYLNMGLTIHKTIERISGDLDQ